MEGDEIKVGQGEIVLRLRMGATEAELRDFYDAAQKAGGLASDLIAKRLREPKKDRSTGSVGSGDAPPPDPTCDRLPREEAYAIVQRIHGHWLKMRAQGGPPHKGDPALFLDWLLGEEDREFGDPTLARSLKRLLSIF